MPLDRTGLPIDRPLDPAGQAVTLTGVNDALRKVVTGILKDSAPGGNGYGAKRRRYLSFRTREEGDALRCRVNRASSQSVRSVRIVLLTPSITPPRASVQVSDVSPRGVHCSQ